MPRRTPSAIVIATLLGAFAAHADETRLAEPTALRESPDGGALLGSLTTGVPVTVIERQGEWARVQVEGWVRIGLPVQAEAAAGSPAPTLAPAAVAVGATARLEGTLAVRVASTLRKKQVTGSGQQVWVLPASFDVEAAGDAAPEDAARLRELDAEAARLGKEAARAMQGSSFTDSTMRHDELMAQRAKVLRERAGIVTPQHGRREAAARKAALYTAVCDARGYFVFPDVARGSYRVYARLVDRELDLEWIEAVEVSTGGATLDLDESKARGMLDGSGG